MKHRVQGLFQLGKIFYSNIDRKNKGDISGIYEEKA